MKGILAVATALLLVRPASAGRQEALDRLTILTNELVAAGEQMIGSPVAFQLAVGDSTTLPLSLLPDYAYNLYIRSDAFFNDFIFYITSDSGWVETVDEGDEVTLNLFPPDTVTWTLHVMLVEADTGDSAAWAGALFKAPRIFIPRDGDQEEPMQYLQDPGAPSGSGESQAPGNP
jgi:hypothetical protein